MRSKTNRVGSRVFLVLLSTFLGPLPVRAEKCIALTDRKLTVRIDETLGDVSRRAYGTSKGWQKIYEANRKLITLPDEIEPGIALVIPGLEGSPKQRVHCDHPGQRAIASVPDPVQPSQPNMTPLTRYDKWELP